MVEQGFEHDPDEQRNHWNIDYSESEYRALILTVVLINSFLDLRNLYCQNSFCEGVRILYENFLISASTKLMIWEMLSVPCLEAIVLFCY